MSSLLRVSDWPFSTKFVVGAVTSAAVPPLAMGALGMFQQTAVGWTADRMVYFVAAVCAATLACTTCRVFTRQASRITALVARLPGQAPRTSEDSPGNAQEADGVHGTVEKTLALIQSQTEHLTSSVATMDGLATSIERVAEYVALSATTAEQALTTAQHSVIAVQSTLQEFQQLRLQIRTIAGRIKHLEEHAGEVEALGTGIADLADRTSVLALNVSVHAARPDGLDHDSAIVAAEVEHLAGRTVEATRRIVHLVHTMQRETGEVVSTLEGHTTELVQWAEHSSQASQALGEVERLSVQLTEFMHAISQAVAQQASSSATLSRTMGEMSVVTQQTAAGTKSMATSMNTLTQLAGALRNSVNGQRQAA